jgi:uncharacterized membrane protein YphA (DoxX/SURF4 family)
MAEMTSRRAAAALLILRVSLGLFLLQWGMEKLLVPEAAIHIGQHFYGVALSGAAVAVSGALETLLAIFLLVGVYRGWTYGIAVVVHAFSVAATWRQLLHPWAREGNHLFIAGVPVLAALILLYMLRASDAYSVDGWRGNG